MSSPVTIASFGKPFGVRGWIKVNSYLEPKASMLAIKSWLITRDNNLQAIIPTAMREHGDGIIVKLPGYDAPETVSALTNTKIAVSREDMPQLLPGEYYWSELIGLSVVNLADCNLGTVQDLMSAAPGANDVLIVVGERRRLIPYISSVIIEVDQLNKIIRVDWDHAF